jgi:hypothetical protein
MFAILKFLFYPVLLGVGLVVWLLGEPIMAAIRRRRRAARRSSRC